MPFGHNCEYPTFDACVTHQKSKGHSEEAARKICGALQAATETKCAEKEEQKAKKKEGV